MPFYLCRDPDVWEDEHGTINMLLASGLPGYNMVLLYQSQNLRTWNYSGIFFERPGDFSVPFECPNLMTFNSKYLKLTSYLLSLHLFFYCRH